MSQFFGKTLLAFDNTPVGKMESSDLHCRIGLMVKKEPIPEFVQMQNANNIQTFEGEGKDDGYRIAICGELVNLFHHKEFFRDMDSRQFLAMMWALAHYIEFVSVGMDYYDGEDKPYDDSLHSDINGDPIPFEDYRDSKDYARQNMLDYCRWLQSNGVLLTCRFEESYDTFIKRFISESAIPDYAGVSMKSDDRELLDMVDVFTLFFDAHYDFITGNNMAIANMPDMRNEPLEAPYFPPKGTYVSERTTIISLTWFLKPFKRKVLQEIMRQYPEVEPHIESYARLRTMQFLKVVALFPVWIMPVAFAFLLLSIAFILGVLSDWLDWVNNKLSSYASGIGNFIGRILDNGGTERSNAHWDKVSERLGNRKVEEIATKIRRYP